MLVAEQVAFVSVHQFLLEVLGATRRQLGDEDDLVELVENRKDGVFDGTEFFVDGCVCRIWTVLL